MFAPLYENSKGHWNRYVSFLLVIHPGLTDSSTIHGMVYNAMKLFMEINPQLFDECSNDYTENQSTAEQRQLTRQHKWDVIAQQAKRKSGSSGAGEHMTVAAATRSSRSNSKAIAVAPSVPAVHEEPGVDPLTQDSQKRLDALKLQDEVNSNSNSVKDHGGSGGKGGRRPSDERDRARTGSAGSGGRSQR